MSNDTDAESSHLRHKRLHDAVEEAMLVGERAVIRAQKARANGGVDQQLRTDLQDTVIELYTVLKKWRDDDAISDDWQEYGLDRVGDLLNETYTVEQPVPGSQGRQTETREVPQINQLSATQLVQTLEALITIGKDLGFAPATAESTPRTEIGDDLIEEVEEWRKQNL